jgi:LysM repeat protein
MIPRAVLALALIPITAIAARSAELGIEFTGVLTAGGQTRIAVTDKASRATTWVEPGQEFRGFQVLRYDPAADVLVVKKGLEETHLALVSSKAGSGAPVAIAEPSPADEPTTAAVRSNLRRLVAAARQYQAERGAGSVSFADLVGPGKPIPELSPVAGENYSTLNFGPNVTAVSVTTANGATISLDIAAPNVAAAPASARVPPASVAINPASQPAEPERSVPQGSATLPQPPADLPTGLTRVPSDPVSTTPPADPASTTPPVGPKPAAPEAPAPTNMVPSYTIQAGDTWENISAGTGVPVQELRQMNPEMLNGTTLPTGQTLRLRR